MIRPFDSLTIDGGRPFVNRQDFIPDSWPRIKDHLQEGNECGTQRWTHCRRFPKIVFFFAPKMDGENNGKPHKNGWFWGAHHYFRKHPNIFVAFVGSFECFDVGLTISFLQLDFLFMSVPSLFPQLRCQKPEGAQKVEAMSQCLWNARACH